MSRRRRIALVTVAGGIAAVLAAGGAIAYWSDSGSGSGTANTTTTQPVTLTPASVVAGLYPGGQADVALTVYNPNAARVKISVLSLDTSQGSGGFAVDANHAGCPTSALSFTTQTNGGAGWVVSGGSDPGNNLVVTLSNALSMSASAPNACQGATFTVYLKAS